MRERNHSSRPAKPSHSVGSLACETLPSALHRETNARIAVLREPLFNDRGASRLRVRIGAIRPSEQHRPLLPLRTTLPVKHPRGLANKLPRIARILVSPCCVTKEWSGHYLDCNNTAS